MNTQPKFSLLPLSGDDWETRYTKSIIRNMVKIKDLQGFTTQDLVDRCNQFLGEENKIKLATLNGLFAGKRKSITAAELQMFASALDVPLLTLLYLPQEDTLEIRPGHTATSSYAIRHSAAIWNFYEGDSALDLEKSLDSGHDPASYATYLLVRTWFTRWDLYEHVVRLMNAIGAGEPDETLEHYAKAVTPVLYRIQDERKQIRELGVKPDPMPETYDWVDTLRPDHFSKDLARAYFPKWLASKQEAEKTMQQSVRLKRKWMR